ncbi:MAG: hypothetical protein Q9228_007059 [Teloschistes exilis]
MATIQIDSDSQVIGAAESAAIEKKPKLGESCDHCGQPAALCCSGCVESPTLGGISPPRTFYCSPKCQRAAWDIHKKICSTLSARKRVYRAGNMIQKIFYAYRERAFEKMFTKIEVEGDTMYMYEGEYGEDQYLVPFPHDLFSSEEDKWAAFTFHACSDAVAFMCHLLKMFLKGLYVVIDEVEMMKLLKTPRETCVVDQNRIIHDRNEYRHEVFRVVLKTGEMYALDFSGAQYGYHDPVLPWDTYVQSRLGGDPRRIKAFHSFGNMYALNEKIAQTPGLFGTTMKVNLALSKATTSACEHFAGAKKKRSLGDCLKLPQATFLSERDELIDHITKELRTWHAPDYRKEVMSCGTDFQQVLLDMHLKG